MLATGAPAIDPDLLRALADPATYAGHPSVTVHETHASCVFVAGDRAYKIKKPVALGFLDYSTLALRFSACREEVRVNRELAPGLYLGVCAITSGPTGFRLAPERARDAIEYAVEMRTFREQDTLAGLIAAGSVTRAHIAAVAVRLVEFYRSAAIVEDAGPERVRTLWSKNVDELERIEHPDHWRLDVAREFGEWFVNAHASELQRRALLGLVRDGHGDLRCEHVLVRPAVKVVDRVEFDTALRENDVAGDLAFLAMDLEDQGQRWAAGELVSAFRHAGMSAGSEALRSFYAAHWALVRTKVALIAEPEQSRAERLWSLAELLCWRARAPVAVVICGPAASGKSTLAGELSRCSQMTVVSSDATRKRLGGLAPTQPARAEHYSAKFTRATYEQLAREAAEVVRQGSGVLVDATCRSRRDRAPLLEALRGYRRMIVRCEIPLELALSRAAGRMGDPRRISDATPEIARDQFQDFEELRELPAECVLALDATQHLEDQVAAVARAVDRR